MYRPYFDLHSLAGPGPYPIFGQKLPLLLVQAGQARSTSFALGMPAKHYFGKVFLEVDHITYIPHSDHTLINGPGAFKGYLAENPGSNKPGEKTHTRTEQDKPAQQTSSKS